MENIPQEREPEFEANFDFEAVINENSNFELDKIEKLTSNKKNFLKHIEYEGSVSTEDDAEYLDNKNQHLEYKIKTLIEKAQQYSLFLLDPSSKHLKSKNKNIKNNQAQRKNNRKLFVDDNDEAIDSNTEKEEVNIIRIETQPSCLVGGTLQPHQIDGLNWMIGLYELGINGILADEMGLGKTIQTISLIAFLQEYKKISGPFLIVAPKSTLGNWYKEFQKWLPLVRVIKLLAIKEERTLTIQKYLNCQKFDVCLTSYEGINTCISDLKKFHWRYVIIDEAHRIKNDLSLLSNNLKMFTTDFKLLLTGTPLQNNLHELWSLLNFLLPDIFDCSEIFDSWFEMNSTKADISDKEKEKKNLEMVSNFHKILKPFILRRTKKETQLELKPKKEIFLYIGLTELQLKMYKSFLLSKTVGSQEDKKYYNNIMMQLKKVCNHPYLFEGVEDENSAALDQHIIDASGKMIILDKLLHKLYSDQNDSHQVLIFSQMTSMLDIIEDYCNFKKYEYCRIDGNTDIDSRDQQISEFVQANSKKFVFLLSTRAGGLGINLPTADTVVLYDSDWNPQADLQAMDRAHRIGQKKQVNVYRFITEDSIEEKIVERQLVKLKWDHLVIQQGRMQPRNQTFGKEDLKNIVQYGASKMFKSTGKTICDEDIDALLDRCQIKSSNCLKEIDECFQSTAKNLNLSLESINIYQFQSINYLKKKKEDEQTITQEYYKLLDSDLKTRREKRYQEGGGDSRQHKTFPRTQLKPIILSDHIFYENKEKLAELLNKESELKHKKKFAPNKNNSVESEIYELTVEEDQEKKKLLNTGFINWSKQDFNAFVAGCEMFGRNEFGEIAKKIGTKSIEEVKEYSSIFWARVNEIQDSQKIINKIEKGERAIEQNKKAQELINLKCQKYQNLQEEFCFDINIYSKSKSKSFTFEHDKFLICTSFIEGYGNWDKIKECIRKEPIFRFDHFIKSREESELNKRITSLLKIIEKELNVVAATQIEIKNDTNLKEKASNQSNTKLKQSSILDYSYKKDIEKLKRTHENDKTEKENIDSQPGQSNSSDNSIQTNTNTKSTVHGTKKDKKKKNQNQ